MTTQKQQQQQEQQQPCLDGSKSGIELEHVQAIRKPDFFLHKSEKVSCRCGGFCDEITVVLYYVMLYLSCLSISAWSDYPVFFLPSTDIWITQKKPDI